MANGPSEYSLMWANNHINGMSWADLVELIQTEAVDAAKAAKPQGRKLRNKVGTTIIITEVPQ